MKKEDNNLDRPNNSVNFWLCAALLAVLLVSTLSRDITRPFYGLHSWAQASGAWVARSHVRYGLGYTKGLSTWAVGQPPTENPTRYFDHPNLPGLTKAAVMAVLGVSEWSSRSVKLISSVIALMLFLRILRGLLDDKTTILAGLIYVAFPLTGYFGLADWPLMFSLLALWNYLVLIGGLRGAPPPARIHKWGLAIGLFLALQFGWAGFFYAFAIGTHYVARCVFKKQRPDKILLAILIIAPLSSLAINMAIMAGGYGWDLQKIAELYKWRSAKGEMREFVWSAWFSTLWEFAVTNYTLPVLVTAILYLTIGQLVVFAPPVSKDKVATTSKRFPQLWLFLMPGVFLLLTFKGLVWRHQYWQRPLAPFIAIATALAIMLVWDVLKKVNRRLAAACAISLVSIFMILCIKGTNFYYSMRWQPLEKIKMFKMLNQRIPSDKALLSYEDFIVKQHKSKGGFYRPEIAWYLDRDIVPARSIDKIKNLAATGKYPCYLVPYAKDLLPFINQLTKLYKYEYITGTAGEKTKDGKFFRAGIMPYMIFDLSSQAGN